MKINIKVRAKNWLYWAELAGTIIAMALGYVGVQPEALTSWGAFFAALGAWVSNPFALAMSIISAIGIIAAATTDPTTVGLGDSQQALTYERPKGE